MTRPILRVPVGLSASAIDKVERLLELLAALRDDPALADAFVLHGGTALNLFHDDAPRLSVDIGLMFIAEREVDAMRRARPDVDARIRRVIEGLGYLVAVSCVSGALPLTSWLTNFSVLPRRTAKSACRIPRSSRISRMVPPGATGRSVLGS